jgi:ABC-type Fe3+-hydroxamate transport system substrate-binding protein
MRLKKVVLLISVFWVVVFCICQGTWAEVSIRDFRGKEVVLEEPAHRIISLYTAHTESLYFLGA